MQPLHDYRPLATVRAVINFRALIPLILAVATLTGCQPQTAGPAVSSLPYTETAPACVLIVGAALPIHYVGHGTPVVTVDIQGVPEPMLIDTGSYRSFISTEAFNALKTHTKIAQNLAGLGLGGTNVIKYVTDQEVTAGAIHLHAQPFGITDVAIYSDHGHTDYAGILGADFLAHFDIGLDLPDNQVTLYAHQNCKPPLIPWPGEFSEVPLVTSYGGQPTIPAGIDGGKFSLILDTGAETVLLLQQPLIAAGEKPESVTPGSAVNASDFAQHSFSIRNEQFARLRIGAESFYDVWLPVALNEQVAAAEGCDGLIGDDYFATHRVYIDNATHMAYLSLTQP